MNAPHHAQIGADIFKRCEVGCVVVGRHYIANEVRNLVAHEGESIERQRRGQTRDVPIQATLRVSAGGSGSHKLTQ